MSPISFRAILFVAITFCAIAAAQITPAAYVGIGIQYAQSTDGTVLVQAVLPDGPAEKAGIKDSDEILSVEGKSVADLPMVKIFELIRGAAGTEVSLTVRTKGERPRQLKLTRGAVTVPQPATNPAGAAPKSAVRFTRVGVKDPGINNIEAISFLIPAGWKTDGGVQWFPDHSILANLLMKITDPQTGAQIEFLPAQNFTWINQPVMPMQPGTNYMGNIVWQPIADIPTFIKTFYMPQAMKQLQNAKEVSVEPLPKVAGEIAKTLGDGGTARAARVRYEYMLNNQTWEEDVFVTLTYFPWQMGTIWSVHSAYAFRAPKGSLDLMRPTMNTTITTARLSQEWFGGYMYVQKLFSNRMNQGIQNAKALSDTITRNSEEIRQMYSDAYKQRSESQDRISQNFSEYIRGVETYKNPYEDRPVQLPSGYNDYWVNGRGEYILSGDVNYNPNLGDTTEWRKMDRKPAAP